MHRPSVAAVVAALALTAWGCTAAASKPRATGAVADVVVRDFELDAPTHVAAGDVTLRVHNRGPDDHELIVVRATGDLPMRHDGLTIDEDAIESRTVVALEPVEPDTVTDVHVHLRPGRYEFVCNMLGHYMGGMHAAVVAE